MITLRLETDAFIAIVVICELNHTKHFTLMRNDACNDSFVKRCALRASSGMSLQIKKWRNI